MSHFFAFLSRMKFIQRWGLMRNTMPENIQEHSLQVAMIAHGLAAIRNTYFKGEIDAAKVAVLGMYHEIAEVFTGDLPTPVKYFNPQIKDIYKDIENMAQKNLYNMLPDELKNTYSNLLIRKDEDTELWRIVKAADKISAYLKCVEELKAGNQEFSVALKMIRQELDASNLPEVKYFMEIFAPSFSLSVDELNY
ncbi:MAG TPA: 5'-deoxynucleotidase [Methylomusa anaerophila]|uniref:5'-deoxynucleotidase n=1 Tax=Methylomusa anaerophila TaxID=1930071 RepID=A0A348AJC5_9FIRM|nr:5'-deoxynucleotidase [Methylomusa anaerophila]BBB91173.1 5'-deoxynucleotidase YfbR [Methylomusa anaerophila]HML89050.1 5'-deoxynucleotidase [Methylomusa anaerophila]